jgi:hypothetical protein
MILRSKKRLLAEVKMRVRIFPVKFVRLGSPYGVFYSASDPQYGNSTSHLFSTQRL